MTGFIMLIKFAAANFYAILQFSQQVTSIYTAFNLGGTSSGPDQSISYSKKFVSLYPNHIFL